MKTFSNFVNGKKVPALSGKTVEIINPSTGRVYATAPDSAGPDVEMAMKAAADAFPGWRDSTPSQRQRARIYVRDDLLHSP